MNESTDRRGLNPPPSGDFTLENARKLCKWKLVGALREGEDVIFSGLMSMGKSFGAVFACHETGIPITILTGRGHEEQYGQFAEWCEEFGLTWERLPSFSHDCNTFLGEHGEEARERAKHLYDRGAKPSALHGVLELPCIGNCEYLRRWDELDPTEYDVLIGHYKHAFPPDVTRDRSVIVDEFPDDSFEVSYGEEELPDLIEPFLEWAELPFDDFHNFMTNRWEKSASWFDENGFGVPAGALAKNPKLRADAPVVAYSLMTAKGLENGWESASFSRYDITGVLDDLLDSYNMAYNRDPEDEERRLYLLNPPDWSYARNVIGLDGLPTPAMWGSLIPSFEVRYVLSEAERKKYITEALRHEYVLTTDATKPYSAREPEIRNRVNVDYDAAVIEGARFLTGETPALISTARANKVYEDEGLFSLDDDGNVKSDSPAIVSAVKHYGNLTGSNEFKEVRVGVVSGSRHFGDAFVKKWGAYCGHSIEREGRGEDLTYGEFGDELYRHMTAHETLQAVMRFGRDGEGAIVFVNTNTLPGWVPLAGRAEVYLLDGNNKLREIIDAVRGRDTFFKGELPVVGSTAGKWLGRLREAGYVETGGRDSSRSVIWRNIALDEIERGFMVVEENR